MKQRVEHIPGWQIVCCLIVLSLLTSIFQSPSVFAQETNSPDGQPSSEQFPDGITPSDVFARLDLLDRCLDRLLTARSKSAPEIPPKMETKLGPLHVYQMVLACAMRAQELSDQVGVLAVPTLSAKPRYYAPRDVLMVGDLILDAVRRVATKLEIQDLPADETTAPGKSPTDVFGQAVSVFLKLNTLCGNDDIPPNAVYAEMVRAGDDVRSVLRQADPESRYRVDSPRSEPGQIPADVFDKCVEIRQLLNKYRLAAGEPAVPLPSSPSDYEVRPRDVFLQTQIIIAELNFLKLHTNTISSTPLAVPVASTKAPTDVHEQASLIEYLLGQVEVGAKISENSSK